MKIIDLTFTIENNMPTCGTSWHQEVEIKHLGKIEEVGRNTQAITVGSHTGTHMDAPYHFIEDGVTIENMDIERMCGEITVVDFRRILAGDQVMMQDVAGLRVTEKMMFVFGWYHKWKTRDYYKKFPYFSEEAIDYLIEGGMKFMALDTPSPDNGNAIGEKEDSPNHKKLLSNDVIIVEYLNNTDEVLEDFCYEIAALPMKVAGSDGAPCRVIVKESERK